MWSILSASNHSNVNDNLPSPTEFFDLFYELSLRREADYFDYDYENLQFISWINMIKENGKYKAKT